MAGSGAFGIPASSPWAPSLLKPATGSGKAGASPQMAALLKNYPQIRDDLEKNPRVLELLAQMARGGNVEKPLEELRGILVGYLGKRKTSAAELAEKIKEKQTAIANLEKAWGDLRTSLRNAGSGDPRCNAVIFQDNWRDERDRGVFGWGDWYYVSNWDDQRACTPAVTREIVAALKAVGPVANDITPSINNLSMEQSNMGNYLKAVEKLFGQPPYQGTAKTTDGAGFFDDWRNRIRIHTVRGDMIDKTDAKIHAICEKARTDLDILNHEFKGEMSRTNSARGELRDLSRDIVSLAKPS